ncbi:MAG: hypothetical protein V1802_00355 [Candidatus Aenigmatarchaeota archaeon]
MDSDPVFVIPTCRLRDVGKAVELYDENFHNYGRKINIWVFDDSPVSVNKKYYTNLERTSTFNEVYYIGPEEKSKFITYAIERTGITVADYIIYRIFRPSYGGNRNFSLAYTLGRKFISSDDDMQPGGYVSKNGIALNEDEVMKAKTISDLRKSRWEDFDIAGSFLDILGKSPETMGLQTGEYIEDPNYDVVTNSVKNIGNANKDSETILYLKPLVSPMEKTKIRLAQSFRTGTSDIDAVELLHLFLDSNAADLVDLKSYFVITGQKPVVTAKNYRFDCGVSGYDNDPGLPPFFPTNLRFEDYSFRIWASRHPDVATAHVNSIQHHNRSTYMRPPLTSDVYNEIIANFLKRKIHGTIEKIDDFSFTYEYDGVIKQKEVTNILSQARAVDADIEKAMHKAKNERKKEILIKMQYGIRELFKEYDHDMFLSGFSRHIDDQNYAIKDCMTYWDRILEISSWLAKSRKLPMRKVTNKRK